MRILLAFTPKKLRSDAIQTFINLVKSDGQHELEVMELSRTQRLPQYPASMEVTVLIHKIPVGLHHLDNYTDCKALNAIDPVDIMHRFESREWLYTTLDRAFAIHAPHITVPAFFVIGEDEYNYDAGSCDDHNGSQLWIVKTEQACSASHAHQMYVMTAEQLARFCKQSQQPLGSRGKLLAQRFVDHASLLFKCYVVGEKHHVSVLPSLPDSEYLLLTAPTTDNDWLLSFDSQISIPQTMAVTEVTGRSVIDQIIQPQLPTIINTIRRLTRPDLQLFGFDIVVGREDRSINIIDLNYFPSYSPMANEFAAELLRLAQANVK